MLLDLFRSFRAWGWGSAYVGLHPTLTDFAHSGLGSYPIALQGRNLPAMGEAHRLAHQKDMSPEWAKSEQHGLQCTVEAAELEFVFMRLS